MPLSILQAAFSLPFANETDGGCPPLQPPPPPTTPASIPVSAAAGAQSSKRNTPRGFAAWPLVADRLYKEAAEEAEEEAAEATADAADGPTPGNIGTSH